ncbi:MAG: response regulator transcription factor [Spirochaetia bacterium]|uniref:DNA-binding response regulator in two-component regulatory system with PhoR (Or CreC) n=2 Tax=root TaxID=1 RepID=A0A652ZRP2_9SPIR|nr:response regulator transcription factor [Spirochaetia bacterium]MDD3819991.1 response regulator transcription factor [Spirochaetales bacterium]NLX46003.1 response regulator transcription factor [Treponema sp.]VBB38442.1 DNA-binding response regulator in two-component regulatory system with PhoR (or CreC) [uncultured Spirochaetota bacterium]HAP55355.1 DNA-binding response regulator [Spirochaetaceae bacterium]
MAKAKILVVEDDQDIRELLSYTLQAEGWEVLPVVSAEEGLSLLRARDFDCIVLDLMLPGIDGFEFLRRSKNLPGKAGIPILITTARGEDADVVAGLELGAADYVVKPFSPRVLVARIRTALRRGLERSPGQDVQTRLSRGGLVLDPLRHEAFFEDKFLELSATEFSILKCLMEEPGRVFARTQIIDAVKGQDYPVTDRSVDVQILSIRKKLGEGSALIETVRGVGYRFRAEQ